MLPIAKALLEKNGEFSPLAAQIDAQGNLTHWMPVGDGEEPTTARELLEIARQHFSQKAARREIVATAVVYEVCIKSGDGAPTSDGIALLLEDASAGCVIVSVPYARNDAGFSYLEPTMQESMPWIFELPSAGLH